MSHADLTPAPTPKDGGRSESIPPLSWEQRAHPPPFLTLADVAAFLGLPSKESAGRFLRNHGIPRVKAAGRIYVITDSLLRRLRELEETPLSDEEVRLKVDADLKRIAPTARAKRGRTKPLRPRKKSA